LALIRATAAVADAAPTKAAVQLHFTFLPMNFGDNYSLLLLLLLLLLLCLLEMRIERSVEGFAEKWMALSYGYDQW